MNDVQRAVVDFARSMVGQKEIPGNQGFENKNFDLQMRRVGFENGWAWCVLFAELCWSQPTYPGKSQVLTSISDNFTANAVRTFENFERDQTGLFKTTYTHAEPGDVVIWLKNRDGQPVKKGIWTLGHAGIVERVIEQGIVCIEGNTNSEGGREGLEVAGKHGFRRHLLPPEFIENGLSLKGFIRMVI